MNLRLPLLIAQLKSLRPVEETTKNSFFFVCGGNHKNKLHRRLHRLLAFFFFWPRAAWIENVFFRTTNTTYCWNSWLQNMNKCVTERRWSQVSEDLYGTGINQFCYCLQVYKSQARKLNLQFNLVQPTSTIENLLVKVLLWANGTIRVSTEP